MKGPARSRLGPPEHRIAFGVYGWLETPHENASVIDYIMVGGWAFATDSSILAIEIRGLGHPHPAQCGLRRTDVESVYPDAPGSGLSGFTAWVTLKTPLVKTTRFEVWALLENGTWVRLFERRVIGRRRARAGAPPVRHTLTEAARRVLRHPGTLLTAKSWRHLRTLLMPRPSPGSRVTDRTGTLTSVAQSNLAGLDAFLAGDDRLAIPSSQEPSVSAVVVVWNHAELTLKCLRSLAAQTDVALEAIVVDNASTDATAALLDRVDGISVIRNETNVGFTAAVNIGARRASGRFLLFLNNDAELMPGSVGVLAETCGRSIDIGAVGGKLVFPNGLLQEAGSIVWRDGSCEGYGRNADPSAPEYNFERKVDFCSGAMLLTPRALFQEMGGFDERYRPAYFEDVDYCVRLWSRGLSVVYQPAAQALHCEFGSSTSTAAALDLQRTRHAIFVGRHDVWLSNQTRRTNDLIAARCHPHGRPTLIFVDDDVPEPRFGAGFPRAAALLEALLDLGFLVTVFTTSSSRGSAGHGRRFPAVELIAGSPAQLPALLSERRPTLVVVSRPHNLRYLKAAAGVRLTTLAAPCIYDAESVFAIRDQQRHRLVDPELVIESDHAALDEEVRLAEGCEAVLTVNPAEQSIFLKGGHHNVVVVGHAVRPEARLTALDRRRSLLFVGAFSADSPNEDALMFLSREIVPRLRLDERCDAPLVVCGAGLRPVVPGVHDPTISWHSDVEDLRPFYEDARVFVAPMRYGSGIPLKVIEAAAQGIPVVATTHVARQLHWTDGLELLTADDPNDFARAVVSLYSDAELWTQIRDAALRRVIVEYDVDGFRRTVRSVVESCVGPNAPYTLGSR